MITDLTLSSFRGYTNVPIRLAPMTLITGMNGSGKTHILEAIHWACGGSITPNLLGNTEQISLSGRISDIPYTSEIRREDRGTSYFFQEKKYSRTKYLENLPIRSVIFSPFDMHLAYLAPGLRRDALDSILDRSFAQFHTTKREYEQVLRQRNALLKAIGEGKASKNDLDFWDEKFATLAEVYALYRTRYRDAVREKSAKVTSYFPEYTLEFRYFTKYDLENVKESILAYLGEKRERDILSGHTHIGPHLDDYGWEICIGENIFPVSEYLSRGENKIILLGMKMIEIEFLEKMTEKEIILLFDDMFSELDNSYSERLLEAFRTKQICITAQHIPSFLSASSDFACIETENL